MNAREQCALNWAAQLGLSSNKRKKEKTNFVVILRKHGLNRHHSGPPCSCNRTGMYICSFLYLFFGFFCWCLYLFLGVYGDCVWCLFCFLVSMEVVHAVNFCFWVSMEIVHAANFCFLVSMEIMCDVYISFLVSMEIIVWTIHTICAFAFVNGSIIRVW